MARKDTQVTWDKVDPTSLIYLALYGIFLSESLPIIFSMSRASDGCQG